MSDKLKNYTVYVGVKTSVVYCVEATTKKEALSKIKENSSPLDNTFMDSTVEHMWSKVEIQES